MIFAGGKAAYEKTRKTEGKCYGTSVFAIGTFGPSGGDLKLAGNDIVRLEIPPGALEDTQTVYLLMHFDEGILSGSCVVSPQFECGPDGLTFKVLCSQTH